MNNSTKKFIISNTCYALSEVLKKASETQKDEVSKNTLFGLSIAFKIAMNVFIVKGVFDKLSENKESELNEIVIDNAPSASITNSNGIPLFSSNNQRI